MHYINKQPQLTATSWRHLSPSLALGYSSHFPSLFLYVYNIIVNQMILCSCRLLEQNQLLTLKFDQKNGCIIIFLIAQDDKYILTAKITSNAETKPLLKLFGDDLLQFYNYLSSPQCQLQIHEEVGQISIKYEVTSLLTGSKQHSISLPTQPYLFLTRRLSNLSSRTSFQRKPSLACEKQHIMEGIYEPHLFQLQKKDIREIEGHPGWFYNESNNVLLQVGRVDPLWKEDWEIKTHHFNVNLNRHHTGELNKYGLTFGLAHPSILPHLGDSFDDHLSKTISVKVQGQKVYSQCMSMREWLDFNEHMDPQSLQIYVLRQREGGRLRTKQIEIYLNHHKRINLFPEDTLHQFQKELEMFNEFAIFLYFKRSFMHFNFSSTL